MLGTVGGCAVSGSIEELEVLVRVGNIFKDSEECVIFLTPVDSTHAILNLGLNIGTSNRLGNGTGLLVDPLDDGVRGAATGVVLALAILEENEGGEALDLKALSKSVVFSSVALGNVLWGVLSGENGCCS